MVRRFPFPIDSCKRVWYLFEQDTDIKAHPDYVKAKAGCQDSAINLVSELAKQFLVNLVNEIPENMIFVAPFAKEATGDNAIPQVLAMMCAMIFNGAVDDDIVQINRVYHTGADPMERLISQSTFEGLVTSNARYILVDDVVSMGGTLAELSNYIQHHGGVVYGVITLVNAGRNKNLCANRTTINKLKERFNHEIRELFNIEPEALTFNESNYLIGFRSTDEIRNRRIKAEKERNLRLHAKGIT